MMYVRSELWNLPYIRLFVVKLFYIEQKRITLTFRHKNNNFEVCLQATHNKLNTKNIQKIKGKVELNHVQNYNLWTSKFPKMLAIRSTYAPVYKHIYTMNICSNVEQSELAYNNANVKKIQYIVIAKDLSQFELVPSRRIKSSNIKQKKIYKIEFSCCAMLLFLFSSRFYTCTEKRCLVYAVWIRKKCEISIFQRL